MDKLSDSTPCAGLLPLSVGAFVLSEAELGPLAQISPFKGGLDQVASVLQKSKGLALPGPNQSVVGQGSRLTWFGRESFLLSGCPAPDLKEFAAVTDQTDAWACVELSGEGVEDALARLVPVDLRTTSFAANATVRTYVGHMSASLVRTDDQKILMMVFRSMAETLVEELKEAMEAVTARG